MRIAIGRVPRCAERFARRGVTLLEVLVAIFITAIGLLALLTLFPVGVLSMAQAVDDDRAGELVVQVNALTAVAGKVLPATGVFLSESWSNQSADPNGAAELRMGYERLAEIAADIDQRLRDLAPVVTAPRPRVLLRKALMQIAEIREAIATIVQLLRLLEQGGPNPDQ